MEELRIGPKCPKNKVTIFINGKRYTAFRGETVLAALIASGCITLRKSRKIGEQRGFFCGMGVCYECLVSINSVPNQRSCMTKVEDQMEIVIDES